MDTETAGSTDHFHYRLQADGPYVDSQRGALAFGCTEDRVWLSEDCARTWSRSAPKPGAGRVTFSCILEDGSVVFATAAELFRANPDLSSVKPVDLRGLDGSPYTPHTPADPERPGWYFHTLSGVNTWQVNGREMLVWGNYCNVVGGASPVNIYYSIDGGRTVRTAYTFGLNPHARDDGSPGGGTSGTLLGNPDNPTRARHIHTVAYNPAEDAFYACTGDFNWPEAFECHWLRGTYDAAADEWDWQVLVSDRSNARYKGGGITFVDGMCYWISDSNGPEPYDRGVFRCRPGDLLDQEAHTCLFDPGVESGNMIVQGNVLLASHCAPASPMATGFIVSTDFGRTWAQYDLAELGQRSPCRFHAMNDEGWFRVGLRTGWVDFGEVLFIKPGTG